ncbi:MAG TPA: dihydrofolate reductase family protein [Alphaproteobacteria bacterium]|nr:dihydrofolate reductase family protein [Alphaproteobacteria bacterium]
MSRFVAYIAASLDVYIATADGAVGWLDDFGGADYGYDEFYAGVSALVMGRATYDQIRGFGDWPYGGKRSLILTSRALEDAPPETEAAAGPATEIAARLRGENAGTVWIVGGGKTLRGFLAANAVDEMEIFLMPRLLGAGVPLFPDSDAARALTLKSSTAMAHGVVRLVYQPA